MNKIILIGRFCKEPSLSYKNETAICNFYLAVDKPYKADRDESEATADFLPCVMFGKRAEVVAKNFHKGNKIALQGRGETSSYTKDDKKQYSFSIVANDFEFCESKEKKAEPETEFKPYEGDEDMPF